MIILQSSKAYSSSSILWFLHIVSLWPDTTWPTPKERHSAHIQFETRIIWIEVHRGGEENHSVSVGPLCLTRTRNFGGIDLDLLDIACNFNGAIHFDPWNPPDSEKMIGIVIQGAWSQWTQTPAVVCCQVKLSIQVIPSVCFPSLCSNRRLTKVSRIESNVVVPSSESDEREYTLVFQYTSGFHHPHIAAKLLDSCCATHDQVQHTGESTRIAPWFGLNCWLSLCVYHSCCQQRLAKALVLH